MCWNKSASRPRWRRAEGAPAAYGPREVREERTSKPNAKSGAPKTSAARAKGARGKPAGGAKAAPADFRAGSKQAKIVDLMKRAKGATLDELVEATEWLPHTTRAALTRPAQTRAHG
jgi:hypothetical protein